MDDNTKIKQNDDLTHITQEMYKKNLELAERNKMLDLLRKIDQIILGSLTKVEQIADQVTHAIITDTAIKFVSLYLLDNKNDILNPLSIAFSPPEIKIDDEILHVYYSAKIQLSDIDNPLIKAIKERKIIQDFNLSSFFPQLNRDIVLKTQNEKGIERLLVHPFFVRKETAGVIVFGMGKTEITNQYWDDFIFRLPEVISIAINNALLYQKIEENNDQLKQLDVLKDEFVSVASHELRTPMTAIKSYIWMALNKSKTPLDEEVKKYLDIAYSSTERLLRLVEDMLTVSRIEGKRLALKNDEVNLLEITEQLYNELRIKAQEKNIQFTFTSNASQVCTSGDKDKLREVLQNLVGNALKFTPQNGKITTTLSEAGNQISIEITNSGSFISSENISKLFEKFTKLEESYTNKTQESGTGLGLYICKQIVEMHKGRIDVSSDENSGTTFAIYLPILKK